MRTLALLLAVGACHKTSPNCERAVKHVIRLTTAGPAGSEPSADEQRAIEQVVQASIDRYSDECLSDAQRDCIVAAKALDDPALVAKKPSWLLAPIFHPELLDELKRPRNTDVVTRLARAGASSATRTT